MPSVCVEDGLTLDIHRMVAKHIGGGVWAYSGSWGWWRDGERRASIRYHIHRESEASARMTLRYSKDGEPVDYSFRLVGEPCRFGGLRWFALCPRTGRKVAKLTMPPGARHFYARQAWRIAYRSQNMSAGLERLSYRRDRYLWRKLKTDQPDLPLKPKGMRWKTYEAHLEKLDAIYAEMDDAILRHFGPFLARSLR